MNRLLLFFALLLTAATVKASEFTWTDTTDATISVTASHDGAKTQVITVSAPGALAAFVTATKDNAGGPPVENEPLCHIGNDANRTTLVITGELNADDLAALNSTTATGWGTFTDVDLSGATFNLSDVTSVAMSGMQYLILPEGIDGKDMDEASFASMNSNNPALLMAASVTNVTGEELPYIDTNANSTPTTRTKDTKRLALYSWQQNSASGFVNKYGSMASGIDKLSMAGVYGDQDLYKSGNKVFGSNDLHYFDFTGATFDPYTITSYNTKHQYGATYTNGASDSYTGAVNKTYENVTTNALYFLNKYNVMTCSLPTGNYDVPPQLFCTTNGWNYPLIEVVIPDNITSIGREAFYNTHLKDLILPASVTNVQDGAFGKCQFLEEVDMETTSNAGQVAFGEFAFGYCYKLKHFSMREGVVDISTRMFEQCASLESIRIPSTCETVGMFAFSLCYGLHSVTIPSGLRMIGYRAFNNSGLTDIYLLATRVEDLPLIYGIGDWNAVNSSQFGASTFTPQNLIGNKTAPQQSAITGKTSAQALAEYQEKLSDAKRYLGSNNCYTYLHYTNELKDFFDAIDYSSTDPDAPSPGFPNYVDLSGKTYISETYGAVDAEGKRWPMYNDFQYRINAGSTTGLSRYPWRQFALQYNMKDEGIEFYSKEYDETWYTICYPWNVSDESLFEAFNQAMEIVDFVGAEVIQSEDNEDEYNLVLHFDQVPEAAYMDESGVEFTRVKTEDWTRVIDGVSVTTTLYSYTNKADASDLVTFNKDDATKNVRYYSIKNIMARAGHPYMIHPASVEYQGRARICTISGVKRINATTDEQLINLEDAGKQERTATTRTDIRSKYDDTPSPFANPVTGGGGKYTFKGYLGRGIEASDYVLTDDKADIPKYSYFLATKPGEKYPQFFREMANKGERKWNIYTAVVIADEDAITNIEGLDGMQKSSSANMAFGEWEQVEADAIEEIISEAEKNGQDVRRVNLNVVYNVNGQVVRTDGQVEGLPKGLYIVNGKKYMVK